MLTAIPSTGSGDHTCERDLQSNSLIDEEYSQRRSLSGIAPSYHSSTKEETYVIAKDLQKLAPSAGDIRRKVRLVVFTSFRWLKV